MPKVVEIIEKRKKYKIQAKTSLGGKLKERFLDELERGEYKENEIVRMALDQYLPKYEKKI